MIRNERQYRITKAQADKFESALLDLQKQKESLHPKLYRAQEQAIQGQFEELLMQLEEYDAIKEGGRTVLELSSFDDISIALIQGRIASGLTQKELAERLGLKEQQVQRYESTDYASASLTTIGNIIKALDISVREEVYLPTAKPSLSTLFSRLKEIGLEKSFILQRLTPELPGEGEISEERHALNVASVVDRVFGIRPIDLFSNKPLWFNTGGLQAARFKTPSRINEEKFNAYTIYVHYLALLVLEATPNLKQKPIPSSASELRDGILKKYGNITFEFALRYVWELGIPILPLSDSGAFHGACWRVDGRNVIVLKQNTQSNARWLFDLIHETEHAAEEPELKERSYIETSDISERRETSEEEKAADERADDVILHGRAIELFEKCHHEAKGNLKFFRNAVRKVAVKEGVPVDSLANFVAYALTKVHGENWWGTANNLQVTEPSPLEIARTIFFEYVQLRRLNRIDRALLMQAVTDREG